MHFQFLTHALKTSLLHFKLPPTLFPTTPDSNNRNGVSDKVTWLNKANTINVWTAWAQYHSQWSHHTRKFAISVISP